MVGNVIGVIHIISTFLFIIREIVAILIYKITL